MLEYELGGVMDETVQRLCRRRGRDIISSLCEEEPAHVLQSLHCI